MLFPQSSFARKILYLIQTNLKPNLKEISNLVCFFPGLLFPGKSSAWFKQISNLTQTKSQRKLKINIKPDSNISSKLLKQITNLLLGILSFLIFSYLNIYSVIVHQIILRDNQLLCVQKKLFERKGQNQCKDILVIELSYNDDTWFGLKLCVNLFTQFWRRNEGVEELWVFGVSAEAKLSHCRLAKRGRGEVKTREGCTKHKSGISFRDSLSSAAKIYNMVRIDIWRGVSYCRQFRPKNSEAPKKII